MLHQATSVTLCFRRSILFRCSGVKLQHELMSPGWLFSRDALGIRSYSKSALSRWNNSHPMFAGRSFLTIQEGFKENTSAHVEHVYSHRRRGFSTTEDTSFSPLNWWRGRQEKKEADKYKEEIAKLADMEVYTIDDMLSKLDEAVKSWTTKVMKSNEYAVVKQMHQLLTGIISVIGSNADQDRLENMTRKEKLEAAIKGEATVEEVNILINQFRTMTMMHLVLRRRKLQGKSMPETAEVMQSIMMVESPQLISKEKKKELAKKHSKQMMRRSRR